MLKIADDGLSQINVDRSERDKFLNIIKRRLSNNMNGASWTKQTLRHLRKSMTHDEACAEMLNRYFNHQIGGQPVSEWEQCWR